MTAEADERADDLQGYRGAALGLLKAGGLQVGDMMEVRAGELSLKGTLVPRYQHDDDRHIVLKLRSGYNVGIEVSKISSVIRVSHGERPGFKVVAHPSNPALPLVSILGTGGTIASRVDYRTGAVHPATTTEELYSLFPELSEVANIRPEVIMSVYSENLEPRHWETIAKKVIHEVNVAGASGVVITMGTDTLGYSAAALSFALRGLRAPVIVVGSQRSSDRPSSDAYLNLIGAASIVATGRLRGVHVIMHENSSDERLAIHRGTRVRKNHTSGRYAFQSIGVPPVGFWSIKDGLETSEDQAYDDDDEKARSGGEPRTSFDPSAVLVKFFPSMSRQYLEAVLGTNPRGVVIEGSGLGHLNSRNIETLARYLERKDSVAFMTSQCIWGRVDMNVYDTGRDLLRAGVLPLEDMLSETALVKLMWALANSDSPAKTRELMLTDIAGEITRRSLIPT